MRPLRFGAATAGVLLLALAVPARAAEAQLTVSLLSPPNETSAAGLKARVTITPASTKGDLKPQTVEVALPAQAVFSVPPGSGWEVAAEVPGYWSRRQVAGANGEAAAVTIQLFPAGFLAGEVRAPAGQAEPKEISLRFRSAPETQKPLPEMTESCPVSERHFRCALPAGRLDVRFRARGYLTHYRWGIEVPLRKTLAVGTLELKPGASVVGWVEAPEKGFRFQDVSVELQTRTLGNSSTLADASRRTTLTLNEKVSERGFFEIAGVAPGSYVLVARHPRYAPARVFPLEVSPGAETEIKRIVLEPAVTLEVHVDPPLDVYQRPWTIELLRQAPESGTLSTVRQTAAAKEGVWKVADLEPGHYLLRLNGAYRSNWYQEELDVSSGMAPREIRLPLVQVDGDVALGGKAIAALLWFGGSHAAVRVATKSGEDGRFSIVLPERETWRVEVSNAPLGIYGLASDVVVHRAPGEDKAHVTIDLPDTAIRGDVVDDEGKPAAHAKVSTDGPDLREVATASDGTFELKGLSPGDWKLQAELAAGEGGETSSSALVHLDKQPVEGVHLVLQKRIKLSGLVVGPDGGGVPGAHVVGLLEQEARYLAALIPEASTDVDGQFTLWLPAAAEGVQLTVLPPGFALTQLRVDARNPQPLIIPVDIAGGTLVLSYAKSERPLAAQAFDTFVFHEYQLPYSNILTDWAAANGVSQTDPLRFTIPALEPGTYTACFGLDVSIHRGGRLPGALRDRCVSGQLGPFGELVLKVPGSDGQGGPAQPAASPGGR